MLSITIVVPLFNEEDVVEKFYRTLKEELMRIKNYTHTIIFVVDGGKDSTAAILRRIAAEDNSVQVLVLSRNFGHQMALLAGIDHACGDVVITMDGDLQHPPRIIKELIAEFEKGNDIVHAVRKDTEGIGFFRKLTSHIFYRFVNIISDTPIIDGAADFRLVSRRIRDILHTGIRERGLFLRGVVNWLGFNQSSVYFVAEKRAGGKSKYSLIKLIRFAFSGSVSFSRKPLRLASFFGLIFAIFGFFFIVWTVFEYYFGVPFPAGWATVVILLSVFGGLQLLFLGIVGEYIGAIFDEIKARPHYLIDEKINV